VSGNHRTSNSASGGYRTASGSHRAATGGHHTVGAGGGSGGGRPGRGRLLLILTGAVVGMAACAVAVVLVVAHQRTGRSGVIAPQADRHSATVSADRMVVPDSCGLVDDQFAGNLVPNFDRNQMTAASNTDQHSQCVWSQLSGDRRRQLTVELRAIAASGSSSGSAVATQQWTSEQADDLAGKGLTSSQHVTAHRAVDGVGDAAYAAYNVDDSQGYGDAAVNVRLGNILITVHYGGSDGGSANATPLASGEAMDGAASAAQKVAKALANSS
jgi:hypothetical protein